MAVTFFSLILIFFNTLTSSCGAFLFKKASGEKKIVNKYLLRGLGVYFFSSIFLVLALKQIPLGIAYPLTALTYVWTQVVAYKWGGETVSKKQIVGVFLIVGGVFCLSVASL